VVHQLANVLNVLRRQLLRAVESSTRRDFQRISTTFRLFWHITKYVH